MIERNSVLLGDCLELMKDIPDKSIDMILTDPPYLHEKGGMKCERINKGVYGVNSETVNNLSDFGEMDILNILDKTQLKMLKINMYIFCSKLQIPYYLNWALKNKYKYDILLWEKNLFLINKQQFARGLEYIIRIYENNTGLNTNLQTKCYNKLKKFSPVENKLHESEKPINLIKELIKLSSKESDLILDPFAGSGTTAIACMELKRDYILMEKEPKYYDIIQKRISEQLIKQRQLELI